MISSGSRSSSAPAGYRFPREVIAVAVRWYLRYGLSYRDVEELLAERGIAVDHVTVYRWVQRFTPEFIDAARAARHATGERWFVDETYVKVAGRWTYLYRALDQHGQVIDVLVSTRRDAAAAREFFTRALRVGASPVEVTTDRAPIYPPIVEELEPPARHVTEQYANNRVETDHGRLKSRAASDARAEAAVVRADCLGRTRLRAESAPRPLRAHRRHRRARSGPRRVRRTRARPLTEATASTRLSRRGSDNATAPASVTEGRVRPDSISTTVSSNQASA